MERYRAELLITVLSGDFARHLEALDGVSQGSLEQVWFRTSQRWVPIVLVSQTGRSGKSWVTVIGL